MLAAAGKEKLVLDLSCRRKEDGKCYIVTDRWQRFTEESLSTELLEELSDSAAEFLIHAVDVEGKQSGIDEGVLGILADYEGLPVTYAGGIRSMEDIETIRRLGKGRVNFTVGSALDLFGGGLDFEELCREYA